jgi:glycosyltransferase involved in cell wall biosynthesis
MRRKVNRVDAFLTYTRFYSEQMAAVLHVPSDKMHVVPIGINLADFQHRTPRVSSSLKIGYLARIAPEKGLDLLCEAYRILRQEHEIPQLRLEVAGYLAPEYKRYLATIQKKISSWGLGGEFHYHGVLDRKNKLQFLRQLDVFCVPVTFDDPKGLPVLEAVASGVPVVQPNRGAFREILSKISGGLLVSPDAKGLAEGLRSLLTNPSLAAKLAQMGVEGVHRHHSIAAMADETLALYESLVSSFKQTDVQQPV